MIYNILLFVSIFLNIFAQALLKNGMSGLNFTEEGLDITHKINFFLTNLSFWGSLILYGFSFAIYAVVLSKMELSKAYPVSSISAIVIIFLFSIIFINESFTIYKVIGLFFCILGVLFLFK